TIWWFYATPLQCVGCEPHRMEIYHFVNRAAERLNPKAPILFLTPYARSVGDCAVDILYGLLKARREGKKAVLLFPSTPIRTFPFRIANREFFDLCSDYSVKTRSLGWRLVQWLLTMIFSVLRLQYPIRRRLPRLIGK